MRWQGFRKVRKQVCKRIERRIGALGLSDVSAYQSYLEQDPEEWRILDSFCCISISRFYRDKGLFQFLERDALLNMAQKAMKAGEKEVRCWSIGCASGEEPYTVALIWDMSVQSRIREVGIRIVATDADQGMINRSRAGCYSASSLKELPEAWRAQAFVISNNQYCIREEVQEKVNFLEQDIRSETPDGLFHLILCRNIVFTYFDEALQKEILEQIKKKLVPGGALVIGIHETLPHGTTGFEPMSQKLGVYLSVQQNQNTSSHGEQSEDTIASPKAEGE